ncbi:DIAP2-like protein [Mya arenaria]|uniref:DIAP2-like protein n=1 Tax=Mya arenaria TaxID=6604 RepID=A0ABY7EEJ6_MYAAR|nr:DIAP2-like protein [Mya arenaria]
MASGYNKNERQQKADTINPIPISLGISTLKPKFQQYALPSKRYESFTESSVPWPLTSPVKVEDLVAAELATVSVATTAAVVSGTGRQGTTRWNSTPSGTRPANTSSSPREKHYIHSVEAGENPDKMPRRSKGSIVKQTPAEDSASLKQAAAEFGYSKDNINIAACIFRKRHGADLVTILMEMEDDPDLAFNADVSDSSSSNPVDKCFEYKDDNNLQSLIEENQRLKDSRNCKICLDNRADVIFLPCGHIVSCPPVFPRPLPESTDESADDRISNVAKEVGCAISLADIDRSHRLGKPKAGALQSSANRPRDVVVKFVSYRARSIFMRSKSKLKDTNFKGVFINEHLTPLRSDIFYLAMQLVKKRAIDIALTFDGTIKIKISTGRVIRIENQGDLDKCKHSTNNAT